LSFKALAEQGDSRARYNLGLAYAKLSHAKRDGANAKLSRHYLLQSRSSGLVDSYLLISSTKTHPIPDSPQVWLFSQPEDSYTLQLTTGKTPDSLKRMKQQLLAGKQLEQAHNLAILAIRFVDKEHNNASSTRYVLVYGVFDTYQNAKTAIDGLPEKLQKLSPWIRPFRKLQHILSQEPSS